MSARERWFSCLSCCERCASWHPLVRVGRVRGGRLPWSRRRRDAVLAQSLPPPPPDPTHTHQHGPPSANPFLLRLAHPAAAPRPLALARSLSLDDPGEPTARAQPPPPTTGPPPLQPTLLPPASHEPSPSSLPAVSNPPDKPSSSPSTQPSRPDMATAAYGGASGSRNVSSSSGRSLGGAASSSRNTMNRYSVSAVRPACPSCSPPLANGRKDGGADLPASSDVLDGGRGRHGGRG